MLWLLAGNSLAPNNFLTACWWTVGIIGLIPSFMLIETKEGHKNRNCEEAEWYISTYQRIWFSNNPWKALSDFDHETRMCYDTVNDYRGKKRIQLGNDIHLNLSNKIYHRPLVDTYYRTYSWMSINCYGHELYEPKYQDIVNDIEKLRAWKPSMEIDVG